MFVGKMKPKDEEAWNFVELRINEQHLDLLREIRDLLKPRASRLPAFLDPQTVIMVAKNMTLQDALAIQFYRQAHGYEEQYSAAFDEALRVINEHAERALADEEPSGENKR